MSDIEENKVVHYCTQSEAIDRINLLLVGNGHPEDGLAFKVAKMTQDTADIKEAVNKLGTMYKESLDAAISASHALDKYKAETAQFEAGKEAVRVRGNLRVTKVTQIIAAAAVIIGLIIGYANLKNTMITKLDKMETEYVQRVDTVYIPK